VHRVTAKQEKEAIMKPRRTLVARHGFWGMSAVIGTLLLVALFWMSSAGMTQAGVFDVEEVAIACVGDCTEDGVCTVDELILGISIALGTTSVATCPALDPNGDDEVTIDEVLTAVNHAVSGCPAVPPVPLLLTVTKAEDTNDGSCDADCSLREAILRANEHPGPDTVTVPEGIYTLTLCTCTDEHQPPAATGDLDITGDLTLIGAGAGATVIDGNATYRVFHIQSGTTSMAGVSIQNGQAEHGGGVLVEEAARLELTSCTVSGNSAEQAGGGIANWGTATLTNCTVSRNSAVGGSEWGPSGFGGAINNEGTVTLTDCAVIDNNGDFGGAINNEGTVTLTDCTVRDNSAVNGGGINNTGTATLTNCTISRNSAVGGSEWGPSGLGGGIFSYEATTTVTNCTVSGNWAVGGGGIAGPATLTNCTVSGNSARIDGGGILGTVMLTNCTLSGNSAERGTDCSGTITSGGHNLDDDGSCGLTGPGDLSNIEAHLAPLGDYGGPSQTHALCTAPGVPHPSCTAASPALDAGDNAACPAADQRGVERPQPPGGGCDIGAYEAE
jgi:CSLREA domain-containing protein